MKFQWTLLLGIFFALVVSIFAVINVDPVTVNYFFGEADWPLILVILGSVFMGGIIIGSVGLFRLFVVQRKVKALEKENLLLKEQAEGMHKEKAEKVPLKKSAPGTVGETGE
ncbi:MULTISPECIES: lipopolysaccharide assembly LapA domain-containing protein [unclassified Rossellomorea]|jgi:lipopolysaccharide assembly protein A|uniref:LapA family protein n=1 Tax=unclassified Rossellomorea TaxID=2837526 RepID=UPI00260FB155|nr:lipopolysaccharide assembly protein LapA domain-containing protein [uncultured Rossellomorea sp.]